MADEKSGFELEFTGTYVLKLILVLKHNLTLRRLTSLQPKLTALRVSSGQYYRENEWKW